MKADPSAPERLNRTRFVPGQTAGHYESFYQRANHPTKPWAFWIRYTIFSPHGRPDAAVGELWAIVFDGETGTHAVAKEEYPIGECDFSTRQFAVRIRDRCLRPGLLHGEAAGSGDTISWNLTFRGDADPLYLLPRRLYRGGFPKAKSLVGLPLAVYRGELVVNGRRIEVDDWIGSQNHNWGSRHTDQYAFGQVAGFDNAPDSFLEVVTARTRVGPVHTPWLTFVVVRHGGREHALVSLPQARRAQARFGHFRWSFRSEDAQVRLDGTITAGARDFVGLRYDNPPGGIKHCLNTKIGMCRLTVTDTFTGRTDLLETRHRALFEMLGDDRNPEVPTRA